jgi:hypothetical protein
VQNKDLPMQLMCMCAFLIWSHSQVTEMLSNSEDAKWSKHNTDHAVHKLALKATQRILRSGYLKWLQLQAVRFLRPAMQILQRPGMPESLSVSAADAEQAVEQSSMQEEDSLATDC